MVDPLVQANEARHRAAASVTFEPGAEKHWHGATPTTAITHTAIQENLNGEVVKWMEKFLMNNTIVKEMTYEIPASLREKSQVLKSLKRFSFQHFPMIGMCNFN